MEIFSALKLDSMSNEELDDRIKALEEHLKNIDKQIIDQKVHIKCLMVEIDLIKQIRYIRLRYSK